MKKVLLILVAIIGFGISANAQDMILKKDASEIKAQVLEITDQQIKYKDFEFQNGPTRSINISEVFMIIYESGQKEVFNKTVGTQTKPKKFNENYALLHLYRLPSPYGSAVAFDIDIAGEVIWRCKDNRKKTVKITKEGLTNLHAKTETDVYLALDIEFGQEYYVECSIVPGVRMGRPLFVLQLEKVGTQRFNKIRKDDTQ